MTPLVSICLPNLNTRRFLGPRMETVLAQTFRDWELVVCDSYSDDGSWEFLNRFAGDPRVRLHQVPREGLYAGWNECLRRAQGEFVYMATSDDTMQPDLLAVLLERLARRQGQSEEGRPADVAVCDYQVIDQAGAPLDQDLSPNARAFYGKWMTRPHLRDGRTEFLLHAALGIIWVTMTAVLFRRRLLTRTGVFNTRRGVAADQEWQMRASLVSDVVYEPRRLATWRQHSAQATAGVHRKTRYDSNILQSLEAVLADPKAGVPESWRRVPHWRREIVRVQRSLYHDSFALYGNLARKEGKRFLRSFARAAVHEPGLAARQLCRGFRWSHEFSVDAVEAGKRLLALFEAPWPPQPLEEPCA